MADKKTKHPENVSGKYYVDEKCIHCAACFNAAPDNFDMIGDSAHSHVFKQPENKEEEELCKEAIEICPVEAIGDDGGKD